MVIEPFSNLYGIFNSEKIFFTLLFTISFKNPDFGPLFFDTTFSSDSLFSSFFFLFKIFSLESFTFFILFISLIGEIFLFCSFIFQFFFHIKEFFVFITFFI
ncbi:hypothetical protein H8356DRAFT_1699039 [Neocallimastix lanati (nom. inval.)]|nr:hypothetical protein H8356DRAFT_1699039 [Neocallimastix sp. JGI-2020a]